MVANHAQKKIARRIMADSEKPIGFTDAMAHVTKIDSLRRIRSRELPAESKAIVAEASRALVAGSDLVIFGLAGSGKSTAAYSVLQAVQLRAFILTNHYLEAAWLRSFLDIAGVYSFVQSQHYFTGSIAARSEVLMVDELRSSFADQGAQLSTALPRILVIHGEDLDSARWRLERMMPELELRSPVFLESVYDRELRARGLRIHRAA